MNQAVFPFSSTGRKYGYLTWSKSQDDRLRGLLGGAEEITLLLPGGTEMRKRVDWKHRRISIGYSLTRRQPQDIGNVALTLLDDGRMAVAFV